MTVGTTGLTFYQPTVIANLGFTSVADRSQWNVLLTLLQFDREKSTPQYPDVMPFNPYHCNFGLLRRQCMATSTDPSTWLPALHTGVLQRALHLP